MFGLLSTYLDSTVKEVAAWFLSKFKGQKKVDVLIPSVTKLKKEEVKIQPKIEKPVEFDPNVTYIPYTESMGEINPGYLLALNLLSKKHSPQELKLIAELLDKKAQKNYCAFRSEIMSMSEWLIIEATTRMKKS